MNPRLCVVSAIEAILNQIYSTPLLIWGVPQGLRSTRANNKQVARWPHPFNFVGGAAWLVRSLPASVGKRDLIRLCRIIDN